MGACMSEMSAAASSPAWEEGADFHEGTAPLRMSINKRTGKAEEYLPEAEDRPETDFFEVEANATEAEAKQFMAVKPWLGAIREPDDHAPVDTSKPDVQYAIDYVYGYRCQDSRQNVYYNPDGNVVYMTACLGVILDKEANTQTYFGGGAVENTSKQVASDRLCHNNDVMCLSVNTSGDREWAVTGQVGKSPSVFVWNTRTGESKKRFNLAKDARAVAACAISSDTKYIATADKHDQHHVSIFEVASGKQVLHGPGGPGAIFDLAFTNKAGAYELWSAGAKHIMHWEISEGTGRRCIFGQAGAQTSFACATADDQGNCYTGGANSLIYVWAGKSLRKTCGVHKQGFVGAILWNAGKLYSGGKDGRVCITDTSTMECERAVEFGVLPRAIDVLGTKLVVGLRTGSIVECDLDSGDQRTLMESHNDGEVWGLDLDAEEQNIKDYVYTTGDDNQVKKWDPASRKCVHTAKVNTASRKAARNKASTLGKHPESQAARAVAVSCTGDVAVCANDGSVTIRSAAELESADFEIKKELQDSGEWIEVAEYSPDGQYLAVGSHDTNIYIYDAENDYALVGKCAKHNATITCLDWSQDGTLIRSVCNGYELLFFTIPDCAQDPSGASNTTGTMWASQHCKFGWTVDGLFPRGTDGSHINGVDASPDQSLIAAGDDYGLVQLFRNPCRKGSLPVSLRGHSEHVVRVKFGRAGLEKYLFSVGGYDQTLFQWVRQ